MKKLLILSVFIFVYTLVDAQYAPEVTHFMYDHLRTNPGSAGNLDMISASAIGRTQWLGMPGAPTSYMFNMDAPFTLFGVKHGVGVNFFHDQLGNFTDNSFAINYAYRFNMAGGTLGLGLQAGFIDTGIKNEWTYPEGATSDPNVPTGDPSGMTFNMACGLFFRAENIYFGISSINLNNPEVSAPSGSAGVDINETKYNLARQFYVTSGYSMQLTNPAYEIMPSVLLKSDLVATDMDINIILSYNKKFWGGVTYRTGEAIIGMLGIELLDGLKVGYSYDFATSAISKHAPQTHEVVLNYCFIIGVEKAPQKYKSIRFL